MAVRNVLTEFDSHIYDFGVAVPNEKVKFKFIYKGEDKLLGVKPSCGCTNLKLDGNEITGELTLASEVQYKALKAAHMLDENGNFWSIQGKVAVPLKSGLKPIPADKLVGEPIPQESKTFKVYLDDGEDMEIVDEDGIIKPNPNKLKAVLTIRGFVKI